jgi:hypothetical protein|tara:strand:- start:5916 stop:6431 length:516 start_codon:yes stop_codon:yes gene_type:complete
MATYDLTLGSTFSAAGKANTVAKLAESRKSAYMIDAILDISAIANYTNVNGDIFQVLEIPANTLVLSAGVEVLTVFDGTSPTIDVDFAAGDDIVDGGVVTSTGYMASGTNGGANVTSATTWTQLIATTDTIDVKLIAGSADVTVGKLRVFAVVCDVDGIAETATSISRDLI